MRSPIKRKFSEDLISNPELVQQQKILKHRFDQEVYQIQSIEYKGVSLEQSFQKPISVLQVSRAELIRKCESTGDTGSESKFSADMSKRRFYPFWRHKWKNRMLNSTNTLPNPAKTSILFVFRCYQQSSYQGRNFEKNPGDV